MKKITDDTDQRRYQEQYGDCINIAGDPKRADEIAHAIAQYNFEKIELSNKTGRKLYYSPSSIVDRIGELFDQSATVANYQQWGWLNHKPLFPVNGIGQALEHHPWLSGVFELVDARETSLLKEHIPFSLQFNHTPVSSANVCAINCCLADEFNAKNDFERFPILSISNELGRPKRTIGGRYVVLHSGSEGFFDRRYHSKRNPSTESVEVVTREFLDAGFTVVRIGHSRMPPLTIEDSNFIDLTKDARTGGADFGLIYNADFFVGNSSGPMSVASQLGKKILMFDAFPTSHIRHNTHHILRNYKDSSGATISFYDLVYGVKRGLYSPEALSFKNVSAEQPCAATILNQTRLFISDKVPDSHRWVENCTASFSEIPC